ncbi:MAG: hypothetical protein H7062_17680 [Candidatus Saccharimonas sp.]|nr:hypothetical protein [Planctomycetaceae bacterium]
MQQAAPASNSRPPAVQSRKSLSDAANLLLDDYANDTELTSFTVLDGEPVHAAR